MEFQERVMIDDLIKKLEKSGVAGVLGGEASPNETVNVWYVIAKLQKILLESKTPKGG